MRSANAAHCVSAVGSSGSTPMVERNWDTWARKRGELGVDVVGDVLDVVGFVGLPEQQRIGPVVGELLLGEEQRVAGRHDALDGEEAGVAVVGMEAVALPRVVAEHDGGPELADPVGDLPALAERRVELAVGPAEEDDLAGRPERRGRRRAARPGGWRRARLGPARGPTCPSSRRCRRGG